MSINEPTNPNPESFVDKIRTLHYKDFAENKETINPDGHLECITNIPSLETVSEIIHDFYGEALFKKKRYDSVKQLQRKGRRYQEVSIKEGQKLHFLSRVRPATFSELLKETRINENIESIKDWSIKKITLPDIEDLKLNKGKNFHDKIKRHIKKRNFTNAYLLYVQNNTSETHINLIVFMKKLIPDNYINDGDVYGFLRRMKEEELEEFQNWMKVRSQFL